MTTAQQWLDLAERIEAATGADREIDACIEVALIPWPNVGEAEQSICDEDEWSVVEREPDGRRVDRRAPWHFTASIDAAMTLVPDGWDGVLYLATEYTMPCAQLETPAMRARFSMDYEAATGEAVTLPLALCAAACRARAGMEG